MPATVHRTFGQRATSWFATLDDGQILRTAFYVLLAGTIAVIAIDFTEMSNQPAQSYDPVTAPIPPSVDRPEIDPDNPAYNPGTELTGDPDHLREPLTIQLQPGGMLLLEGTIQQGSADRLSAELAERGEYVKSIALNSPGGIVQEALAMGELIRVGGYTTSVANGALCASSCPLILAAGVERHVSPGAAVGVHQIYALAGDPSQPAQAMSDTQVVTATIARYLDGMGISHEVWLHALETPPQKLYYFTLAEMTDYGLATD